MAESIVIVENLRDWKSGFPESNLVTAREYLSGADYARRSAYHIINLCRSYRYQSVGYYCSLLAEARGHRVFPSVRSLQDLSRRSLYSLDVNGQTSPPLQALIERLEGSTLKVPVYFGSTSVEELRDHARQAFEQFPCPALELEVRLSGRVQVQAIRPLTLRQVVEDDYEAFARAMTAFQSRRWKPSRKPRAFSYDLAILVNPEEHMPPSDERALKNFVSAGKQLGIDVDLIGPKDYGRVAEYDALFIRETTQVNHHTYRFARRAEREGMVVMDDPNSILRCTNKAYLAELLAAHRLPTPKTRLYDKTSLLQAGKDIGYPLVMKLPEGAFSRGVFKAENAEQLESLVPTLFQSTELVLAQEYVYTEFDWRVGVLNRQPLYVCQYRMAKQHWQIVRHEADGTFDEGGYRTLAVEDAPADVVTMAVKAAGLIGDGLYGVDLKATDKGVVIIEINDNPSIDAGVEDAVLKKQLYAQIMGEFLRRMQLRRAGPETTGVGGKTGHPVI